MTARTNVPGATNFVLQESIGAYTDEAYTNAKKISNSGIVSGNPNIDKNGETYIGQMRWFKPLNPTINVASLTNAAAGAKTTYSSDFLTYIKTVRTHGADKVNMQTIVTQQDGLAKIGRDFSETRAQDEHNAILAVLKGVAISEALRGAGSASGAAGNGGQTFSNDPLDATVGFYVDLGAQTPVIAATAAIQGAARAENFMIAMSMAFKDYEPEYAYLLTSPQVMASFRSANLVDDDKVTDGNMMFDTLFNGKLRLVLTRATQRMTASDLTKINTGTGVDILGPITSFLVLPGAIAMEPLDVPDSVEVTRDGNAYMGGGVSTIWYRWGYILAPAGYNWAGSPDAFPLDTDYMSVMEAGTQKTIAAVGSTTMANVTGVFQRKSTSVLSLGILPIFHS